MKVTITGSPVSCSLQACHNLQSCIVISHHALQEGHVTPQLGQQLEQLREQVEEGRNAVLEAHRDLLDMADGAIARVRLPITILTQQHMG